MSHRLTKVYALTLSIFKSLFNENAQVYIEHSLSCWQDSLGSLFVPFFSSSFLQCMRRQQIAKKKLGDSKQSAIIWSTQKRILLRSLGAESTKKSNNPWFLFYSVWQQRDATKLLAAFFYTKLCGEPIKPIILTSSTLASKAGGFNQPNTLHC